MGLLNIVQYFIENKNVDKDVKGSHEMTPLHHACFLMGTLPVVEYLISKGANLEALDIGQNTPLHYASQYGKIEIVKYLLSKGANKSAKNYEGKTPYDLANNDEKRNILK